MTVQVPKGVHVCIKKYEIFANLTILYKTFYNDEEIQFILLATHCL